MGEQGGDQADPSGINEGDEPEDATTQDEHATETQEGDHNDAYMGESDGRGPSTPFHERQEPSQERLDPKARASRPSKTKLGASKTKLGASKDQARSV